MSLPPNKGARFLSLAGMTASVVGQHVRTRLHSAFLNAEDAARARRDATRAAGERLAQTLGELKGAVMKVGQMASLATDVLPPELAQALSRLQHQAPPVDVAVIQAQVQRELGAPTHALFSRFDPEPLAAASIGQVHRARTDDGREVVVKVQYPGVADSVDADLAQLRLALRALGLVHQNLPALDRVHAELRARLKEELDYTLEAGHLRELRALHAGQDFLVLPEVVGERSSARVLTLTHEPGVPLAQVRAAGFATPVRQRLAEGLVRMGLHQFFRGGLVHGDPNPANFAAREDGTLVVYDFGCVKRFRPDTQAALLEALRAGRARDPVALDQALLALGARVPGKPAVSPEDYGAFLDLVLPILRPGAVFDFGGSGLHRDALALVPLAHRLARSFQPPADILFLNRVLVGHYQNLRALDVRLGFADLLDQAVQSRG